MIVQFDVLRKSKNEREQYLQSIRYETDDENSSIANALVSINETDNLTDINGQKVSKIKWECSCLQKKCGACAMLINGRPRLACDARLKEYKKKVIRLEPLKKFPLVEDLIVDRGILFENLKTIGVWLEAEADFSDVTYPMAYEGSRCIQCGCCLEICPNFYAGGIFMGMSSMVPTAGLLAKLPEVQKKEIIQKYKKHIYPGCGKSLACRNICPAGIDIEGLLVNSNAIAVWKRSMHLNRRKRR